MTAYELADKLEWHWDNDCRSPAVSKSADMLRQQADRIAELEKQSEPYGWHCFEDDDDCLLVNGQNVNKPDGSWDKVIPLYTTPQTKPLSDEEIYSLLDKCIEYVDDHDHAEFMYKKFARAIEERHGIK